MSKSTEIMTTSPIFLVFLVFLILKLVNVIDWSWWWVTSPLWIPIAIFIAFIFIWILALGIITIFFNT